MRAAIAIFALGALALLAAGCEREAPPRAPDPAPERALNRVVSLSPLATRFVLAIGARGRLVGVDAVVLARGVRRARAPAARGDRADLRAARRARTALASGR